MRQKLKIALIALGCLVAAVIVVPPIENALVEQPSCFAFVGVAPLPGAKDELVLIKAEALASRQRAITQSAIQSPTPPYVIVTRTEIDGTAVNILVAEERVTPASIGEEERFWRINEVTQALYPKRNLPSSDFTAQPTRVLHGSELSRLVRKRCLFDEPAEATFPKAWLAMSDHAPKYYDGGYRLIEINDGERSGYFHQANRPLGITGAIGQHLVHNAIGFSYPAKPQSPPAP